MVPKSYLYSPGFSLCSSGMNSTADGKALTDSQRTVGLGHFKLAIINRAVHPPSCLLSYLQSYSKYVWPMCLLNHTKPIEQHQFLRDISRWQRAMPFPQVSAEKSPCSLFCGEHTVPALSPLQGLGLSHFHEWKSRLSRLPVHLPCVCRRSHTSWSICLWVETVNYYLLTLVKTEVQVDNYRW